MKGNDYNYLLLGLLKWNTIFQDRRKLKLKQFVTTRRKAWGNLLWKDRIFITLIQRSMKAALCMISKKYSESLIELQKECKIVVYSKTFTLEHTWTGYASIRKVMTVKMFHVNEKEKYQQCTSTLFSKIFYLSWLLFNNVHDRCRSVGTVANGVRSKANKTGVRGLRVSSVISVI